jgi:hypothetical protein
MNLERYELDAAQNLMVFEFISEGPQGKITKLIQYTKLHSNIYNLGFGDKNIISGDIDDKVITNNDDSKKVLATVAFSVYIFTDIYPAAWIFAAGNTKTRTRLYRIGITNNLIKISTDFEVYGYRNNRLTKFNRIRQNVRNAKIGFV